MSIKTAPPTTREKVSRTSRISKGQLAILTVVVVASLRSLPTTATFGLGSITLYVLPALIFLIPTALVAAELATGWKGGVYVWVREALGRLTRAYGEQPVGVARLFADARSDDIVRQQP